MSLYVAIYQLNSYNGFKVINKLNKKKIKEILNKQKKFYFYTHYCVVFAMLLDSFNC